MADVRRRAGRRFWSAVLFAPLGELDRPGWELVRDTDEGNALCFDACTAVHRVYRVDDALDDVLTTRRPVLERHGLQTRSTNDPDQFEFAEHDGDVYLNVMLTQGDGGTVVTITARARR